MDENNKVIAFADTNISNEDWWYKDSVAYLNHICVSECYRNQGIGKLLVKRFEGVARPKGAKYVRLLTFYQNNSSISFYKNNWFIECSIYYNKKMD